MRLTRWRSADLFSRNLRFTFTIAAGHVEGEKMNDAVPEPDLTIPIHVLHVVVFGNG